jgi:hypothetical protein
MQSSNKSALIPLRLEYSEHSKLLTGYINKLVNVNRVYPRHLPTQASFRWSTLDPPLTNWPRACINPACPHTEHEWNYNQCWSVRDILLPDNDEIMVSWDHDNIEGKIHDIIVNDRQAMAAHAEGQDLHTITCCNIFGYDLPVNLVNPHTFCSCDAEQQSQGSTVCCHCLWRAKYNWQGKDTKQRVLAKNFNHGSKYTKTWRFVHRIEGIEKYGVSYDNLGLLAKRYITSKGEAWQRKLSIMASIQRSRISRTLYSARRIFFNSSEETGREGFSHMISGTVSDYNNHTLQLLEQWLGDSVRLLHNAHDGDKVAIKKDNVPSIGELRQIIERPVEYQGRSLIMTAGIKIYQ